MGLRLDGDADGDLVGVVDGVLVDGIVVGALDGEEDNFLRVGDAVGIVDGLIVGIRLDGYDVDGFRVGLAEGDLLDGTVVRILNDGAAVAGFTEGETVGLTDGFLVGLRLVGFMVGENEALDSTPNSNESTTQKAVFFIFL